jgi:hypothetical protein
MKKEKVEERNVWRYILKIGRDIQRLAETMQGQARVEPDIHAEIDVLIERLNLMCVRMRAGEAGGPGDVTDRA